MDFKAFSLSPKLLRAVEELGYTQATPIQQAAIPSIIAGRDFLGCAQTGTGKTAAFALPILERLSVGQPPKGRPIRCLILTPTRELALQIDENIKALGQYARLSAAVIFGGVSQVHQVEQLRRGVDVLTATPGRLIDLINQGYIDLSAVEIFVLDEADRMLDMGFIHDVRRIIGKIPPKRQTLLFSATMPKEIVALCDTLLNDPVQVSVTPSATPVETVEQRVYFVDKVNKRKLLSHLLQELKISSALVFTRTKHGADRVSHELEKAGIMSSAIHGDKSQGARQSALGRFKNGNLRILVATDIAARGLDISELPVVVNYDLPNMPDTYVHRIGRTGRAGQSGIAISFCDISEKEFLADIEKTTKIALIECPDHPFPMEVFVAPPPAQRTPRPPRQGQQQRPPRQAQSRQTQPSRKPERDGLSQKSGLPGGQKSGPVKTSAGPQSHGGGGQKPPFGGGRPSSPRPGGARPGGGRPSGGRSGGSGGGRSGGGRRQHP